MQITLTLWKRKKKKEPDQFNDCKGLHGHCAVCGKPVPYAYDDEYYTVRGKWNSYVVCENCIWKVKETCLSNSKSKSRVKNEKGYF